MDKAKWLLPILALGLAGACGGGAGSNGNTNPGQPPPTATVSGTVTQLGGAPLAGATVTAFLTNNNAVAQTALTDANGNYSFTGLQASGNVQEDYNIFVNKGGYAFQPGVGAGGKVTRADYTGQFMGNGINDIAIYFTVIDFPATATPLANADFTAYDSASQPLVNLARTGQTGTYATGDDGQAAQGVAWPAVRFTDNHDGTVTDALTGLVWLQRADAFAPTNWAAALDQVNHLASGAANLSDGSKAGAWRLPNLNELESLVDVSALNPALPANNPFLNVSTLPYWTSTSYFGGQAGSPCAWAIRMSDGRYINDLAGNSNAKTTGSLAVWAVRDGAGSGVVKLQATGEYVVFAAGDDGSAQRGVPLTWPRWIDNGDGSVTDTVTGLDWLKQADAVRRTWAEAVAAVRALPSTRSGRPWRMPNRNEMQSLSDRAQNNHADFFDAAHAPRTLNAASAQAAIFSKFMTAEYYWTSTSDAADPGNVAWTIYSCDFGVYDQPKANLGYSLAVR